MVVFSATGMHVSALSIQQITSGDFYVQSIYGVTPMNDGQSYSQLVDGKRIIVSSFRDGAQTSVLFDVDNTKGKIKLRSIDGYQMSPDERHILLRTETKGIYRNSYTAVYYIYNIQNRTVEPLSDGGAQECPLWSRDGNMVAFVREGNLFLVRLLYNNAETQITKDGKFNNIINGKADWVYEEEFVTNRSFDFNEDGTVLAWIRYDESQVPMFSFPMYKGMNPEIKENALYPGAYEYKYPVPGEKNSVVSVMTYDIKSRATRTMKLPLDADGYIPRIKFSSDADKLLILTQNRHQDRLEIYVANPLSTECRLIVRDEVKPYVQDNTYTNFATIPGGFMLLSERSGYAHLYQYDLNGTLKREIGKGSEIIKQFYTYDNATQSVYYQAYDNGPLRSGVYKTDAKGNTVSISTEKGQNNAVFSKDGKYCMLTHHSAKQAPVYTLRDNKGKVLKTL